MLPPTFPYDQRCMALLDWFAGQALTGLFSAGVYKYGDATSIAKNAYSIGNAS